MASEAIVIKPDDTDKIRQEETEKLKKAFDKLVAEAWQQWTERRLKGKPTPTEAPKIVYCMSFYEERMPQVVKCIERVRPFVDRCVLVYDDSVTQKSRELLRQWNCELHYRKWDNHFSKQRNAYLHHVNEGEWVLVCYDKQTELLTKDGFKFFRDVTFEDNIATVNPASLELEYQKPTNIQKYKYKGRMIHFLGRGIDLLVTPNHSMFIRVPYRKEPQWFFLKAHDCYKLCRIEFLRSVRWSGKNHQIMAGIPQITFLKLLSWYLSEGWLHPQPFKGKEHVIRKKIQISQTNEEHRNEIISLVKSLGRSPILERKGTITFYHTKLYDYFKKLGKSKEKYIPQEVKNLPTNDLKIFLETYIEGDGHKKSKTTFVIHTSSKQMVDDLTEIGLKSGYAITLKNRGILAGGFNKRGKRIIGTTPCYCLSFSQKHNTPEIRRHAYHLEDYDDYVYDITVPNHTLIIRRNGKIVVSGNSDPDELHCLALLKDLRKICHEADKQGINMLGINSHDILIKIDGKREEKISDFFKNLLFRFEEGVRYVGVVHETLLPGVHGWRSANLDKRFYYEHVKTESEIWERACRNFHIAGGGNNLKEQNPIWVEYQKLIKRINLPEDWPTMRNYLRRGNIHPELKAFLIANRNRNIIPDADTELREYFKWYFEHLHVDENTEGWKSKPEEPPYGSWGEIRNYVEDCYMKVLGRHADELGKVHYTQAILQGKIKREQLPGILRDSPEYKMKQQLKEEPIHVGAIVLAKNEEKNIGACLRHLRPFVDYLVAFVDSATNDKTVQIAKEIADAVLVRPFSGSFAAERNRAQEMMPTNWVLHCDADEQFNIDFLSNMRNIIRESQVDSFRFPRLNPQKRDFPDYQVRLLRKDAVEWRGKFSEIPYSKRHNKPIDQVSVKTLDDYPIVHNGEKKDWAKILAN